MLLRLIFHLMLAGLVAGQVSAPQPSTVVIFQTLYTACNCGFSSSSTPIPGPVSFPGSSTINVLPPVAPAPSSLSASSSSNPPPLFTVIPSDSSSVPSSTMNSAPSPSLATESESCWNDTVSTSVTASNVGPETILPSFVSLDSSLVLTPFSALTSVSVTSVPSQSLAFSSSSVDFLSASAVTVGVYSLVTMGDVPVTGVTVEAPSSPSSCFTLPTPTSSLEMLAVSVNQENDTDFSQPMFLYFANNATSPSYIGSIINGSAYTLDLSPNEANAGQLGLSIGGAQSLVFDTAGIKLFTDNCSSVQSVDIANFWQQLQAVGVSGSGASGAYSGSLPLAGRQLMGAQVPLSNFTVEVSVDSYLRFTLNSPVMTFGNTPCSLQNTIVGRLLDNITWTCEYPPPGSGKQHCQDRLSTWMNGDSSGTSSAAAVPRNGTAVLSAMGPFLGRAAPGVMRYFPGADPSYIPGLSFLQKVETVAKQAVTAVGNTACQILHAFDQNELIVADNGTLGTHTLGAYVNMPPTSMDINLAYTATASAHNPPARKVNPADKLLKQLASIFPFVGSLLGALPAPTLPLLGGFLSMPTDGVLASATVVPLTGTITSIVSPPPTNAFVESLPIVTVTHVLGEGWFTPSTWIGSSTTSTVQDAEIAMVTEALSAIQSSAPSDVISEVMAKLISLGIGDGLQPSLSWGWPDFDTQVGEGQDNQQDPSGSGEPVVWVTTTVTVLAGV